MSTPNGSAVLFVERQWLPGWALTLLIAMPLFVAAPLLLWAAPGMDAAERASLQLAIAAVVVVDGLVLLLFGSMRTRVDPRGVLVTFGLPGWIRFRFEREEIRAADARRYRPFREFGGWGIRGVGAKRALNMRGSEGVELTVHRRGRDGTVMIGSQRSGELELALRLLEIPPYEGRSLDPV